LKRANYKVLPQNSPFFISATVKQTFSLERTHIINGVPDDFTINLTTDGVTTKNFRGIEITAKMYWDGDVLVSDLIF